MSRAAATNGPDIPVLEIIRSRHPGLSRTTQRVADVILADPHCVLGTSASHLAELTGTSVGTVVRFCHALGFPGYQDFKTAVASDARPRAYDAVPGVDHAIDRGLAGIILANILASISRTMISVDVEHMQQAAAVLRDARRILVPAAGPSQPVAMGFGMRLSWSGFSVFHPTDPHTQQAIAEQLGPNDVCFAISHSGTTEQTLAPARIARAQGAHTITLTSFALSPIASLCDIAIVAGAEADTYRTADMASRPAHHAVLEAVWALVQNSPVEPPARQSPSLMH